MEKMYNPDYGVGNRGKEAEIRRGAQTDQVSDAYNSAQEGLGFQTDFMKALQAQNGIGNQSSVFNQLQGVANGTGPNPALAQLNQATGQNVAAQNALMAGQRGSSANVGLLARQAAMQGGNVQQQAVGQAANMQAQQSLNAMGQLGNLASQQVAQQANATTGLNQARQSEQQALLNSLAQENDARVGMQSNINTGASNLAGINTAHAQNGLVGGLGLSGILAHGGMVPESTAAYAGGGQVQPYAEGGQVDLQEFGSPQSFVGRFLTGGSQFQPSNMPQDPHAMQPIDGGGAMPSYGAFKKLSTPSKDQFSSINKANGDIGTGQKFTVDGAGADIGGTATAGGVAESEAAMASEVAAGEAAADAAAASLAADEGVGILALASHGGKIPGKAQVKGDSYQNDTVPAVLSPGEIVIPRSILESKNPVQAAAQFVKHTLAAQSLARGGTVQAYSDGGEVENEIYPDEPQAPQPSPQAALAGERSVAGQAPMNSQYQNRLQGDYMNIQNAQDELAGKIKSAGAGVQNAYDIGAKKIQAAQWNAEVQQKQWQDENKRFTDDVVNGHIDPNRYMNSQSTGQKILTTIGLILGGIGAGTTGQANPALARLNKLIDNDIAAQQAELGKKQSLLNANYQKYGSMNNAIQMTRANALSAAKLAIEKAGAGSNNAIEQQRAKMAAGELQLKIDQTMGQMKANSDAYNFGMTGSSEPGRAPIGGSDAHPENLVQFSTPPAQRDETLKAIGRLKSLVAAQPQIQKAFFSAGDENRPMFALEKANGIGESISAPLKAAYYGLNHFSEGSPGDRQLHPLVNLIAHDRFGRISPVVNDGIKGLLPKFGDNKETVEANFKALMALHDAEMEKERNTIRAGNINPDVFTSLSSRPDAYAPPDSGPAPSKAQMDMARKRPDLPNLNKTLKKFGKYGEGK